MDNQQQPQSGQQAAESPNQPSPHPLSQESPPAEAQPAPPATPEETRQELQQAIQGSNEVLATATTILTLFSDTVTLDRAKLTVTKRTFFSTAEVMSIRIEDILNVTATVGPIFGAVKFVSRVLNTEKPYVINHFWRTDALHFKRVTQGYVIAMQRGIDCSALSTKELAEMLDKLGEDDHTNP
jgi:hypothetical protein